MLSLLIEFFVHYFFYNILLHPIMPEKSENFLKCLSINRENIKLSNFNKKLNAGLNIKSPGILFKKIL